MELVDEIAAVYDGRGDKPGLMAQFRRGLVLVPVADGDRLLTGDRGGLRWLLAFSDERELAAWAVKRGGDPAAGVDYLTVRGERLLDVALPGLGRPGGIALDIAGARPMFLPGEV